MKSYGTGRQVDILILYFSKAFDTVPHDKILVGQIWYHFIKGSIHASKADKFPDTLSYESCGGVSEVTPVILGVPQCTVLFVSHINDLLDRFKSQVSLRLFADDCLIYREIKTLPDHIIL